MFGLSGIFSSISSGISSAVSSIGSAVSGFCTKVVPAIAPFIEKYFPQLNAFVKALLTVFDIFKSNEKIDEMGDRALQAAESGIKPENFDKFEDYLSKIRSIELDPKKTESTDVYQKFTAGTAIGILGLEEKFKAPEGSLGGLIVLAAQNPEFFTPERAASFLGKSTDIASVLRYFEGKSNLTEARSVEKLFVDSERAQSPDKSESAIFGELDKASEAYRNPSA